MNRITYLEKEIAYLEKEKAKAEEIIRNADKRCEQDYFEIVKAYEEFYAKKTNKEFVLYDRFPSLNSLKVYLDLGNKFFPLHSYGVLNIKELAELIKHLYQFKTGKEYNILTIGTTSTEQEPDYGPKRFYAKPHIYFIVGSDKTLDPFKEYNGLFVNSDLLNTGIQEQSKKQNIICIEAAPDYQNLLGIECLTGRTTDKEGAINYYDDWYEEYNAFVASSRKQIFSRSIRSSLRNADKFHGIKNVFDFDIHQLDSYIAKILISIIIYKRNNNNKELTSDDYNHIFDVLFGEKVEISEDINVDIPKQLKYISSEKSGL